MTLAAALDVGGTTIKVALVDENGRPEQVERVPTPVGDASGLVLADLLGSIVSGLRRAQPLVAVGITVPGVFDADSEVSLHSTNLGWSGVAIGDLLRARIPEPLVLVHDMSSGALAEARVGAARDLPGRTIFAAVGTGISIAVIDDGHLSSTTPWQGEIGQVYVDDPDSPKNAPESPVGDVALVRMEEVASALGITRRAGAESGADVVALVRAGDPRALHAWHTGLRALAESLAWSVSVLGAHTVVIGGGLAEAGPFFLDPLAEQISRRLPGTQRPVILPARLGALAGCIGAGLAAHDLAAAASSSVGHGSVAPEPAPTTRAQP